MVKFLNEFSRLILFIMDVYIYIHNSVKDKDFETIVKSVTNSVKNILLFIKNVVNEHKYDYDLNLSFYNNDLIVFVRGTSVICLDLHTFETIEILFLSLGDKKTLNYNINCYPYIFIEDRKYIYILDIKGSVKKIEKYKLRNISLDNIILDSIDIEENRLKIKDIVKCSECYYNLTFMDNESFVILIDPINETYSCYNNKYTMEELHQATIDDNEEIIYKF